MKVLIVSGIWPPDVGGPASHAPEFASFLLERGHSVEVVTTADSPPAGEQYQVRWVSRAQPRGVRHARSLAVIRDRAADADLVYATSMLGRASLGAALARRPIVVKLVADEAYERAVRLGLFEGDLDAFQSYKGGARVRALRQARNRTLRRVDALVCPSAYLASRAIAWGIHEERVTVLPNPAPPLPALPERDAARARFEIEGPTLAFAGRITRQKSLEVALAALARVDGVALLVAGDGPDLDRVRREANARGLDGRVRFLGPLGRDDVLALFRAADASVLSSSWENFPHAVVESLAVGTPVISTAAGGVAEVVRDGVNGLVVPTGDAAALSDAIRRYLDDADLRERLREGAAPSVQEFELPATYRRLVRILEEVVR